ncbi:MAG: glycosyltransferase [Patescibacteria group bacterium]
MKKNKIKVGIFIDGEFIPSNSGAANRFHYMSRYLNMRKEIDVVIFLGDRGWSKISMIKKEGFKTYVFNIGDFYQNIDSITEIIKKEKIDLIQFDSIEQVLSQGAKIKSELKIPIALEAHYDFINFAVNSNFSKKEIDKKMDDLKLAKKIIDGVICLSKDELKTFQKFFNGRDTILKVIPSGVDLGEIKPNQVNFKSKKCIFLGNMFFHPNEVAVDFIYNKIYKKLFKRGYIFVMIGDAPEVIIQKYKSKGFVFTGKVNNLNTVFKDALCALAPVFHGAGMRIKLLNYAAAGLPTLITKTGAEGFPAQELLGIINKEDFVNEIELLEEKKEQWTDNNSKLYEYISRNLTWETLAVKASDFYRKIIDSRPENHSARDVSIDFKSEPSWLVEVVKKGRFTNLKASVKKGFYKKVYKGLVKTEKL